ncbi:MAG TPA: C25 family cysteine peptidase, partial [Candidatus Cloacimonadota bacterium]|nr:C25 family cysteine peptidase [Candidatus Cloacimonadota bacterium]
MECFKKLMLVLSIAIIFTQLFGGDSGQFRVNTQNSQLTDIEFNLPDWSISRDHKIDSKGTELTVCKNDIEIPFYSTCIAVPQNSHVEILSEDKGETKVYSNISLSASNQVIDRKFQKDQNQLVEISSVMTLRDYQIVSVNIYPFQYDQSGRKLDVTNQVKVKISHKSGNCYTQNKTISKAFEPLYQTMISNYDQIRETRSVYQKPSILIIHPNNTQIQTRLNQLVEWKTIRGFDVKTVSLSITGNSNSSIKSYIQNEYNNSENPPEYVLLIGDVNGTLSIPSFYHLYAVEGGYGDYPYTHISGNDTLGDLFIGRLSIESSSDFDVMVSKIIFNEKYPTQAGTDWMNRSILMGETNVSGQTCITTNYYIKEAIKRYDSNHEFTELYGSVVNQSQTTAAATAGALNFHYRGYYNMNNYTNSHINNMNNVKKMFNVVWITCNTGNFAATELSRIEKVTRLGTVSEPKGALTAIGMSTSHTLTAYNNLMSTAIYDGLYTHGMNNMGQAMLYAKLRVQTAYSNYSGVANDLVHWLNLMGDPSVMAHKDIPIGLTVQAPDSIIKGQNYIQIHVRKEGNLSLKDAVVTLKSSDNQYFTGYTDENGNAIINLDNELNGTLQMTVTKENYLTSLKTITIQETGGISLDSYTLSNASNTAIVQDINPDLTYTLNAYFKNYSSAVINNIQFRVRTQSPYVTLTDSLAFLGQLSTNTVSTSLNFKFQVHANCPDDYQIPFQLIAIGNNMQYTSMISVVVNSFNFEYNSYQVINYAQNAPIGMNVQLQAHFTNTSHINLNNLTLKLTSPGFDVMIVDSLSVINNVVVGENSSNANDLFSLTVNHNVVPGTRIPMELVFVYQNMELKRIPFIMNTQNALLTDPLGPDEFGYVILDQGDMNYNNCPSYEWIEISTIGNNTGISDPYDNMDMVQSVTLPFPFRFYGELYNQITVSSNGFFVFGVTTNPAMRNTPLPGSGAPVNMVAPFWADIIVQDSGDSGVYTYYHPTLHAFIIEWHNVRNYYYRNHTMSPFTN